jgi:Cytochrome C oxidase, cbb3-type, subunit III
VKTEPASRKRYGVAGAVMLGLIGACAGDDHPFDGDIAQPELSAPGVYNGQCARCHGAIGRGLAAYVDEASFDLFSRWVRGEDREGSMPRFSVEELSDEDLLLIYQYLVAQGRGAAVGVSLGD